MQKIKLNNSPFASGGEGELYTISNSTSLSNLIYIDHNRKIPLNDKCAKIFFQHIRNKEEKLKLMIDINPKFNNDDIFKFCWPENLIYKNNDFIGYTMHLCQDNELIRLYELCTSKINKKFNYWQYKADRDKSGIITRLKICVNLCLSIYNLHKGYNGFKFNIIDLKPQNILLDKTGKIYIVDLDSIEILNGDINHKVEVLTPEYIPAEKYKTAKDYNNDECDNFALAVIIYEILFGIHPYTATFNIKADTIQEKIKHNLYVHDSKNVKILPPPHKELSNYSNSLKKAFSKSFSTLNRTTAEEWGNILFEEIKYIQNSIKLNKVVVPPQVVTNKIEIESNIETLINSCAIYNEFNPGDIVKIKKYGYDNLYKVYGEIEMTILYIDNKSIKCQYKLDNYNMPKIYTMDFPIESLQMIKKSKGIVTTWRKNDIKNDTIIIKENEEFNNMTFILFVLSICILIGIITIIHVTFK